MISKLCRKIVQGPFYRKNNRIDGKVVIITGCNTGIGKETALELASRGAKIYMACRDPVRCEGARLEIIEKTKNENVFNRTLDLGSLESVRKFADKFIAEEPRLDILINNAGVMATPKGQTKDGFDLQFGTNHLGHFLLTNLLLDTLKHSAPSRVVVVSSAIYLFGKINKDDLNFEKSYSKWGSYSQSKLANILFTMKLNEKLHGTDVTVNCCHPGIVKTELARHIFNDTTKSFLYPVRRFFFKSAKAGAQTSLRLALDPALDKSSGGYYFDTIRCPVLPKAKNKEMAEWLWTVSEEMVGLRRADPMRFVPVTLQVPASHESNGHTTIIEVEKVPIDDISDNKKMEEFQVNGSFEKKDIIDKMKKIMEDDKSEKMDEPEKVDRSEKMEKQEQMDQIEKFVENIKSTDLPEKMNVPEMMNVAEKMEVSVNMNIPEKVNVPEKMDIPEKTNATEETTEMPLNIEVQEKLEKMSKDVDNMISKINGEVTAMGDVIKAIPQKIERKLKQTSLTVELKQPMENPNAIEKVDAIVEKHEVTEKEMDTTEKTDTPEKPI